MSTQIKIWQVAQNHVNELEETALADDRLESDLECWIHNSPSILGEDLLIIAKQRHIDSVGRLDLLAIDSSGRLSVIELKRDLAPREAIAQALDYASWLDKLTESEIYEIAQDHLGRPLDEVFTEKYELREMPALRGTNHRILVVGSRLDSSAERIINYLAQRYSVEINALFFRYVKLEGGQELLVRSVLVAESMAQAASGRIQKTMSDILGIGTSRQVMPVVEPFRALVKGPSVLSEEPANAFGGSLRYWRLDMDGKARMVFGVNVSGERRQSPAGNLDVWIPSRTLAKVLGIEDPQVRELLKKLPPHEMAGSDCIVRVGDVKTASGLAAQLAKWFEEYPGYYGSLRPRAQPAIAS